MQEEQRAWQAMLQARIQEAEDAALKEKHRLAQQQKEMEEKSKGPHKKAVVSRCGITTM